LGASPDAGESFSVWSSSEASKSVFALASASVAAGDSGTASSSGNSVVGSASFKVQLDDRGLRLDHEKSPRQGDETTGTAGNLGGNGSPQQAGTMRSMVGFTQTHHSTHPTKTKRAIRCPRAPTGHRCAALVGVGRPAAIGHRHEALVGMVGLVGESFQSAAPGSAGYPTARHTGAARVASGSPAAGRTCNWCAAGVLVAARAPSADGRPAGHQRKRPLESRLWQSQKPRPS